MTDDLIAAAQRLVDVLVRENDALRHLDFPAAVALVAAKEAALAELMKHPTMRSVPPPLATLGRRLGGLAAENQALLERAIAVQTRIVRIVARAAAPPPSATRYGSASGRRPSNRSAAMALSTRA